MTTKLERYTIRPPEARELAPIQKLRHEVLDPQRKVPSDLELSEHDYDPEYIHMAAYDAGKPVSAVRLNPLSSDRAMYLVRKMATAEDYRGKGLGSRILRRAENVAIERGATAFTLDARKEAISFYEKNGYVATGEVVTHSDGIANYTMTKRVQNGNKRAYGNQPEEN